MAVVFEANKNESTQNKKKHAVKKGPSINWRITSEIYEWEDSVAGFVLFKFNANIS